MIDNERKIVEDLAKIEAVLEYKSSSMYGLRCSICKIVKDIRYGGKQHSDSCPYDRATKLINKK